jgi:hypothetical protein
MNEIQNSSIKVGRPAQEVSTRAASPQSMLEAAKATGSRIGGDIIENGVDEFGDPVIIGDIFGDASGFIDNSRSLYKLDRRCVHGCIRSLSSNQRGTDKRSS